MLLQGSAQAGEPPEAPVITLGPTISGTAQEGSTLTASVTVSAPASRAWQWQTSADGSTGWTNISGATSSTYIPVAGDIGDYLRVTVIVTNVSGTDSGTSAATAAVTQYPAPVNTVSPTITGTVQQGETLTSSTGTWTDADTYTYQWQRSADGSTGWADIASATSSTYLQVLADVSQYLRCRVTASNGFYSTTASSSVAGPVAALPVAPANTVAPSVSGTAQVGETLTASAGTWTGTPTPTYAYQWQTSADGSTGWTNISGATSTTYDVQASDEDQYLRVAVTATNSAGSATAYSAATGQVTAPAGGITLLGVEFSDAANTLSAGLSTTISLTIPAGCDAVAILIINSFREVDTSYTPLTATLNGTSITVGCDSGIYVTGFGPTSHFLARTAAGGLVSGAQNLVIDRPGANNGGALHVAAYYLQGADQTLSNWACATAVSIGATTLTNNLTVPANGSLVVSHAGPRKPGDIGGATTINYTTLTNIDGFDDTELSTSTNNNSLATKWAHEEGVSAGPKSISPSWGGSVRCALVSAAIPPA